MIKCSNGGAYLARGEWVPAGPEASAALAAKGFDAAAAAAAGSGLPSHNRSRGEGCAAPARLFSSGPAGPAPSPRFDKFLRLQTKSLFLNAFFAILLVFEAGFTMV